MQLFLIGIVSLFSLSCQSMIIASETSTHLFLPFAQKSRAAKEWLRSSSNLLFAGWIPSSFSFLNLTTAMENSEGRLVDLYIPRKWYASCSYYSCDGMGLSEMAAVGGIPIVGWMKTELKKNLLDLLSPGNRLLL